jgi:ribosomal protein S18 acetylase RimI-like enzyme
MSDPVTLTTGYRPGAIGAIAALHGRHYAASHGFDQVFEAKVARELGDFVCRLDPTRDRLWLALRGDMVVGSIVIDGSERPGVAHLRWFILAPEARGLGLGRRLMSEAMAFCRSSGFESVYLWTLADLHAAIHLYEQEGFEVAERLVGTQWGKAVDEVRMTTRLGLSPRPGPPGTPPRA